MKAFKKGLSLAVALAVALQAFSFAPAMAEETVTEAPLGEPAFVYAPAGGDASLIADGDAGTTWSFDRRRLGASWIAAAVFDAGEGRTFDFNRITLNGKGCRFYGGNEEGSLADIGAALTPDVDYSQEDGYQAFADLFGVEPLGWIVNQGNINNWTDDTLKLESAVSYRYFVVVSYAGWTNADIGEVSLALAEQTAPETRIVTFDEKASVTVDGETISSGDEVEEGKTLVITPVVPEGEELVSVAVNGGEIEAPYEYTVAGEDIVITVSTQPAQVAPETRTVTFDEKASVTVDGEAISSGDEVEEGKTLVITPVVPEGEELVSVAVNGEELEEPYTFVVADADINIEVTTRTLEREPQMKTELGAPTYVFNSTGGNPADMTDGNPSSAYVFNREGTAPTWITVAVYDAGEINKFEFDRIELASGTSVRFFGADEAVHGDYDILDIAATIDETDYSTKLEAFAELYGLTDIADLNNTYKNFAEVRRYRYIVAVLYNGWPRASVNEITLKNIPADEFEKHTVTFGANAKVSVDGADIVSGSLVAETKTLVIEPVLAEGEALSRVMVNGETVEPPYSYVMGRDDVNIEVQLKEMRTVTFGEDVSVTVGGKPIQSGEKVMEGAELEITPSLPENSTLDKIYVNGSPIEGTSFTVDAEDIEITFGVIFSRLITFGENVRVTAAGEPIQSGTRVNEGTALAVEAILADGEILDRILVNGVGIDGNEFTVGAEDVVIELELVALDPDAVSLGKAAYVYNIPSGNVDYLTDGKKSTALEFRRNDVEDTYISVIVYDAGEDSAFNFSSIELSGYDRARFYGTNALKNGSFDLSDISGTIERGHDYSKDEYFAQCFGLTALADLTNSSKSFDDIQSYRFLVVTLTDGWNRNTSVSEVTISNKIVAASLGEVVRAGGEYTAKTGKWNSTGQAAEWTVTDSDLGITSGTSEKVTLWGWIGGDGSDASSDSGVVTFRLKSDTDTYADVKIVGNSKRDERDFTVWVEGEDGRSASGFVPTLEQGESLGSLTLYTVKNLRVFAGVNKITLGSSQFPNSPDFAMLVFVDKAESFLGVGEVRQAAGETADAGALAEADKFAEEFFAGKAVGDELGLLPRADEIDAEVMLAEAGTYNLIALGGEGSFTLTAGADEYAASAGETEYSSLGGLRGVVFKNVSLGEGITELNLKGSGLAAMKLIPQRQNTLTFGDEITVVADGRPVYSGETVPDGTVISIVAFSSDDRILDRILVNGREISGGRYFVFNEDIEIKAEFIDVMYVTVTFDEGIVVFANGAPIASGDRVRGDASLRFACGAPAEIRAVYSVNGTPISGNSYTLNKQDAHISVELTPYDLLFIQDYVIEVYDENENCMRFLLPSKGSYGADITWSIVSGAAGDRIDAADDGFLLYADLTESRDAREIKLSASITVAGREYTAEKTVAVDSHAMRSIGGRNFFVSPIGDSEAALDITDGQFILSGRGTDLWRAPDAFGYLYTRLADENFTISVKADKIEGSDQWRRTGVMLRESADADSRFVMLSFGAANGAGLELAVRAEKGAEPYHVFRDAGYVRNRSSFGYIKLEKTGSFINAYYSEDGLDYAPLNSEPIEFALDGEYLAGLHAVSSDGATYFSRLELNGGDVFVAGDITGEDYAAADGKLLVTWNDPTERSTLSFETIVVTASDENGEAASVEVPKGVGRAVLEGLENGKAYTVSLRAKTAELCGSGENNASPYNALGAPVVFSAMPFNAAEYAAETPTVEMTLSDTVMIGERNRVSLAFAKPQPASAFTLTMALPAGVSADEDSFSFANGCTASVSGGTLTISYSGGKAPIEEIGSLVLTAAGLGSYTVGLSGSVSYYSFEDGDLATAPATLASASVTVVDVEYVTLTFDSRITASIDGRTVASGAVVRGDSVVELSCGVPENAEVTYIVNGVRIEGSTVTLRRVDTHIDVEIVPLDLKYLQSLELVRRTETEAGILFDLPLRGEYGGVITWTLADSSLGDTITEVEYNQAVLTVNMADNNYESRTVALTAALEFGGETYTVEKTVYAESAILHKLGGRDFFLRQIGQDDQSTASVSIENDQISLSGFGSDLWAAPDSFGYFYTKDDSENFTVSVKIDRQEGANQWRRAGLMFRQSDSENEKMVMLDVGAGNGAALEFAYRVGATGTATQLARSYSHANTVWLRLEKRDNKFYAYCSDDGEEFTLISEAAATVRMDGRYLAGIFSESETGQTTFSRFALNGSDVFVSDDITNAAAYSSDGKIRVTWTDPTEQGSRSFEDILVTATDGMGRSVSQAVAKGVGEATFENLANSTMYTVAVQARTGELCGGDVNGATAYRALSAPVTLTAFPADIEYLAAVKPIVDMKGRESVVLGQTNTVDLAFREMQPIYSLSLTLEMPEGIKLERRDVKLDEAFAAAGGTFELDGSDLTISYEAKSPDGILYMTDIAKITLGAAKRGSYTLKAKGSVGYYSYEIGELETELNNDSTVEFTVRAGGGSGGDGGGGSGGGSGSSSGGNKGGSVSFGGSGVGAVQKMPDGADVFADKDDIPDWAKTAVGRLAERGIVSGSEGDSGLMFKPNAPITREEFVKLCVGAFMKTNATASCDFSDVPSDAWYYPYIAVMVNSGIVNGVGDGRFGVGEYITRQDMAVIIYKLHRGGYINLNSGPVNKFSDNDSIAQYALEAVTALRAAGVVNGYDGNTFAPTDNLTRAMAAQIIYGCLN